jgi:cytochrome d ubiquinol oxidase subunit I
MAFAQRSFAIAAGFGLASTLSVIVLGDESGYTLGDVQKVKLAAIEAEWETAPAPAPFTVFGLPNQETHTTDYAVKIPWVMGLIATRSTDEPVLGIKELVAHARERVRSGMVAYENLEKLRRGDTSEATRQAFEAHKADLGYGLLLKRYTDNVADASEAQIEQAAADTIPRVFPLFWTFRVMVGLGFIMLFIFAAAFYYCAKRKAAEKRWLLRMALYGIPLPWIAAELGWFVAEYGRQPWSIGEILPTRLSTSSLVAGDLYFSLAGFVGFYTLLLVAELYLMFKYARLGPSSLHSGRYHFEGQRTGSSGAGAVLATQPQSQAQD